MEEAIANFEAEMSDPDFWNNSDKAQTTVQELNAVKNRYDAFMKLDTEIEDLEVMEELLLEETDPELRAEFESDVLALDEKVEAFELELLLNGEYDTNNAIFEIQSGAGGTEAQDWVSMLYRMYTRWIESQGYSIEVLNYHAGDEAGIKSVTILVKGHNAYGYLKSERGVHRLVRISPFDSQSRRHTSFVSVEVTPEIDDTIEIEVNSDELRIDTYRASGAGGQHVNMTDSAVRITHLPTGIVVSSQAQRSQLQNRETAMNMLKSRLFQLELEKQAAELAGIKGDQQAIAWGSQIRSYVFHPYSMVKDHRTNMETGNVDAVMDGDIDSFIEAYLRMTMDED